MQYSLFVCDTHTGFGCYNVQLVLVFSLQFWETVCTIGYDCAILVVSARYWLLLISKCPTST